MIWNKRILVHKWIAFKILIIFFYHSLVYHAGNDFSIGILNFRNFFVRRYIKFLIENSRFLIIYIQVQKGIPCTYRYRR